MKQLTRIYHNYYDTNLIGFNEKYRYIFIRCSGHFIVYSLQKKSIILDTREFRWVSEITFTDDMEYVICTAKKTNRNEMFEAYLIKVSTIEKGLEYTNIGKTYFGTVISTSRWPNGIILARKNKLEIYDCAKRETIMKMKISKAIPCPFHLIEGEESDLLWVSYYNVFEMDESCYSYESYISNIKNEDEYYKITSDHVEKWIEEKEYWEQYSHGRKIHQTQCNNWRVIKIEDQLNNRELTLSDKRLAVKFGKISLSGNYYVTRVVRAMKSPVYYEKRVCNQEKGEFNGYYVVLDLKNNKVVHFADMMSPMFNYTFDEKEKLIFFTESTGHCEVSICQLEEQDVVNKKLGEVDYESTRFEQDDSNSESLRLKHH